ncbi:MAG: hypothetical protein AB7H97_16540 [Pseudobdellovibrionaceae bacterium]
MQKQTDKNKTGDRFSNVDRDEATLGVSGNRENNSGLAPEDLPTYAPPEHQPEPRPVDPVMKPNSNSTH